MIVWAQSPDTRGAVILHPSRRLTSAISSYFTYETLTNFDAMAAQTNNQIPQGFSVFQPILGAPLQFFPALGTKELDEMLDAYVVGPASVKEKRATVSVDFLEYAQRTGQTFKFYAVPGMMAPVESPTMASPLQASTSASSINASPVASNWDWSAVSAPTPSVRPAKAARTGSTASSRKSAPTDFSHIPGMKILTKDGLDVTNSASRGSKTKEQRDHAHLMRIIKACDSCKKKKIRCDPSHKKRSAAPQPARVTKKQAQTAQPTVAAPQADSFPQTPSLDFDSAFTSPEFENLDIDSLMKEPWEDFIQYPAVEEDPNYDFFLDPQGFFSQPLDQQAVSSTSNSPFSWSDEQFNAYTSSASDLHDYGLIQSTSTSTSPSTLDLDTSGLPPDLPQQRVPLNHSDQQYDQNQSESVAMPDLFQPALAGGFGEERYATLQSQFPADAVESQFSSSTEDSGLMNVSPLGRTTSTDSSPLEERNELFLSPVDLVQQQSSSFGEDAQSMLSSLRDHILARTSVEGVLRRSSTCQQDISNAPHGHDKVLVESLVTQSPVLQTRGDSWSQAMSRSSDLDNIPGADSSGSMSSRGVAHVDESSISRSACAPLSATSELRSQHVIPTAAEQARPSDGRVVDSAVAAEYISDEPITGTDCVRNDNVDVVAPNANPATGTDCLTREWLQLPLQTNPSVAGPSTVAAPLQPQTDGLEVDVLPRLGTLSGQTSSSLVLASATLYGALDMLLAKQQRKSVTDKGRRKSSGDSGSSWLGMCGKLAIIPLATVLASGFLPGWSFVG